VGAVFVPSIQREQLIRPYGLDRLKPLFDLGIALPHLVGIRVIQGQGLLGSHRSVPPISPKRRLPTERQNPAPANHCPA
jgi:hypothetical protein